MSEPRLQLFKTREFLSWVDSLEVRFRFRVDARLDKVLIGHLGDSNSLGDGLFELKWKNGLRVYYWRSGAAIVLLGGGFKGTQERDISGARTLKVRWSNEPKDL